MKNQKLVLIIFSIVIFLILLCIAIYFFTNNNKKSQSSNPNTYTIESTKKNKIEKDGLEVTNIEISKSTSEVKVVTTLVNNSNTSITGFFIEILLLDKDGKAITSIVKSSQEELGAKQTLVFTNYITGVKNMKKIETARIETLEKN